jgi:hypothetical protein
MGFASSCVSSTSRSASCRAMLEGDMPKASTCSTHIGEGAALVNSFSQQQSQTCSWGSSTKDHRKMVHLFTWRLVVDAAAIYALMRSRICHSRALMCFSRQDRERREFFRQDRGDVTRPGFLLTSSPALPALLDTLACAWLSGSPASAIPLVLFYQTAATYSVLTSSRSSCIAAASARGSVAETG